MTNMKNCKFFLFILCLGLPTLLTTCCSGDKVVTPESEKYISDFHEQYYGTEIDAIKKNRLVLYVDYSTCISMGQSSDFFKELLPSFHFQQSF